MIRLRRRYPNTMAALSVLLVWALAAAVGLLLHASEWDWPDWLTYGILAGVVIFLLGDAVRRDRKRAHHE